MRVIVAGAGGRMGQALVAALTETDGTRVTHALDRAGSPAIGRDVGTLAGLEPLGVAVSDNALQAFVDGEGVIDFTSPENTVALAELAAQARVPHVIGTTGLEADHLAAIKAAARHAPIVLSGNMSLGVNLLAGLVRRAARALGPGWDVEVLEMHHRNKVDAPSGTALLLGEAAAEGRGVHLDDVAVRSRDGQTGARPEAAIGFATLRGGSVVGDHTVILAGPNERIELGHRAESRAIFSGGAVRALLWARGREPGLYDMAAVLGLDD
ncbi:MAG: 4-hydroxy-tetrahydrodipicolinate reductase [Pseudomonadota bacterium]